MFHFFYSLFFFFNDTATTEIYTLSLHDALPICEWCGLQTGRVRYVSSHIDQLFSVSRAARRTSRTGTRSEEHTSELQSQSNLVCRLLLEKKKKTTIHVTTCKISDILSTRE